MNQSGIIVLNKDSGITTNKAIQQLKRKLSLNKVGHAGTLDPLASGVVIVLVNTGTKLSDYLLTQEKEYLVTAKLYVSTDSCDSDGNIVDVDKEHNVDKEKLEKVVNKYNGLTYKQTPPIYSAIKVNGRKLYEYARNDEKVEIKQRQVTINTLELVDFDPDTEQFSLKCKVSKGTYIRSLIVDICKDLNTIGHVTKLVRTKSGLFDIKNAVSLDDVSDKDIISNYEVVEMNELQTHNLSLSELNDVKVGKDISIENVDKSKNVFLIYNKELIAIYHWVKDNIFHCVKGGF